MEALVVSTTSSVLAPISLAISSRAAMNLGGLSKRWKRSGAASYSSPESYAALRTGKGLEP